ncbi:wax ester/triacylglycerol synthase family O-acyltransferase [Streptacidiphilus pinicola]|uniref:diacylglycerol O-acyltransferase n=1 Tax=Streptacidiphilus pinicola TaxID=2219663 RepID=A0A2X0IJ53_9ACTN|nr:wax ester/triacylglycerol synthase domain-containing protein [Streptacidiphilus pinicola]RAG85144.1 wax ester/triacylglycerol synthase family O-acyltransferase [Streptacidiphilus pinicola]
MTTRLSPLDHAFWSLESPDAPMHIGALAVFGSGPAGPVDAYAVAALLAERAQRIPRLRRRVRPSWNPLEGPRWEEQPGFDAAAHIVRHQLPEEVTADPSDEGLCRIVGELMARPVSREAPPWEMHLLGPTSGGVDREPVLFLLLKVHHAVVDGLRAMELGLGLLDGFAEAGSGTRTRDANGARTADAATRTPPPSPEPAAGPAALRPLRLLRSVPLEARRTLRATEIAGSALVAAVDGVERAVLHPSPLRPSLLRAAARRPAPAASGLGLALPTVAVDDVRRIRKEHGGTANDVVLAVLAGALRDAGERADVRVLVPVSERGRRSGSGARTAGNRLSGFLVDLPVSEPDPVTRLHRVRDAMDARKAAGPRRGAGAVALLADLVPAAAHPFAAPLLRPSAGLLFDSLVTNVPLPDLPFALAGMPLTAVHPLAPLARHQELCVAVSAFRGRLHLGLRGRFATPRLAAAVDTAAAELLATC